VIVLLAGFVFLEKPRNLLGAKIVVDAGLTVQKDGVQCTGERIPKPIINNVDGEATLLSAKDLRRQEPLADLSMNPFSTAVADLERRIKAFNEFHYFFVQVRNTDFQTVRHREFVGVH
jgi:hypothetical protein